MAEHRDEAISASKNCRKGFASTYPTIDKSSLLLTLPYLTITPRQNRNWSLCHTQAGDSCSFLKREIREIESGLLWSTTYILRIIQPWSNKPQIIEGQESFGLGLHTTGKPAKGASLASRSTTSTMPGSRDKHCKSTCTTSPEREVRDPLQ